MYLYLFIIKWEFQANHVLTGLKLHCSEKAGQETKDRGKILDRGHGSIRGGGGGGRLYTLPP